MYNANVFYVINGYKEQDFKGSPKAKNICEFFERIYEKILMVSYLY
jgi:hypothetical protein